MKKLIIFLIVIFGIIYFINNKSFSEDIILIPLTLQEGFESQVSTKLPLKDSNAIYSHKTYLKDVKLAKKAKLELSDVLDRKFVSAYSNNNIFILFFNLIESKGCKYKYLIQKVKLSKYYYDRFGNKYNEKIQYLVEALKLNKQCRTKKGDEHLKRYSLGNAFKRKIKVEVEVGSGRIPGIVEGLKWPYDNSKLYYRIQDYSENPGYYNKVQYDISEKYNFEFEFDAKGYFAVDWPDFLEN